MVWVLNLMNGTVDPRPDRITLERYVVESAYIAKYMSRVVKSNPLAVYNVLFYLSWFETGKGELAIPWSTVGAYIRSERGDAIDDSRSIRRRLPDLIQNHCIAVHRPRNGPNEISVHLPSEIPACRELIQADEERVPTEDDDSRDYYTDPERRIQILERDNRKCVYCLLELSEDTFVLDHIVPVSQGGTNRRHNLVTACRDCNQRKSASDPMHFLLSNYRAQLLQQSEFLTQKAYLESLLNEQ